MEGEALILKMATEFLKSRDAHALISLGLRHISLHSTRGRRSANSQNGYRAKF